MPTLDYLSSSVVSKRFVLKDQVIFVTFLRINFINCVSKLERIYNEKALSRECSFNGVYTNMPSFLNVSFSFAKL